METPPRPAPPAAGPDYDPRYLAGVALFNRGEYFAAHDVWEELWTDCPAADRRFYQSLIQAAVALYHWGKGNAAGAARLFASGRRYMGPYRPAYRGLTVDAFWEAVGTALRPDPAAPRIDLNPPPDRLLTADPLPPSPRRPHP